MGLCPKGQKVIMMAIKRTPGMTLAEFCKEKGASQVTVQHAEGDRVTHIAGFKNAAKYELQDRQTLWFRKEGNLIKEVYTKKSNVVKNITRALGSIKVKNNRR